MSFILFLIAALFALVAAGMDFHWFGMDGAALGFLALAVCAISLAFAFGSSPPVRLRRD